MSEIVKATARLVDIEVETLRTDAVQSFVKQETILVDIETADGLTGTGYSYTIGTGGQAVLALLGEHLLAPLAGQDSTRIQAVWHEMFNQTRATTTGAITSLALAAIDTALWDLHCLRAGLPLWKALGGYQSSVPIYDTEGGWLHLGVDDLVAGALDSRGRGLRGVKLKIGKPTGHEDLERLMAVREAVGPDFAIMADANQSLTGAEAIRRARLLEPVDLEWLEEPLPADDLAGHTRLAQSTSIPIAVGESMYSVGAFGAFLQAGAAGVIQVDAARVGGITPWLAVAHAAQAANVAVCPHFLMELHVSLAAAVPNGRYVEHIPQLRAVTNTELTIEGGQAMAPDVPGLGIDWNLDALDNRRVR